MNKITLHDFYDISGEYKVVRCKTFEEAKTFWQASQLINHLLDIRGENTLLKIYNDTKPGEIFCFSDEDWWAGDKWYSSRHIYEFEDIDLKVVKDIKFDLFTTLQKLDLDLTGSEINMIVSELIKNFKIRNK